MRTRRIRTSAYPVKTFLTRTEYFFILSPFHAVLSHPVRAHDKRIACEEEFSDSEDEGEGGRRNIAGFKKAKRVKTEGEKEGEEKEKKGEEEPKGISFFFFL